MIIRPATLADLNACLALEHASVTDHVWQMKVDHVWPMKVDEVETRVNVAFQTVRLPRRMRVEYPRSLDRLVENWQRGEGFLVAEVDNEVQGYVDVLARPWQGAGWVVNMAVDRDHRRRGLGTALMRHARQWIQGEGLHSIVAEATTKNYPALCFYRKLGFEFCGFNDHYYANQDIALFFVHILR